MPTGACFLFEPFELDSGSRRLTVSGEPLAISDRQVAVLHLLVVRAGQIVSKDDLLEAGWPDVAVGDNSLEQAISALRRTLGSYATGASLIETVPRRGYRFNATVTRTVRRESDEALEALLTPHRAFVEGRAALDTLETHHVVRAREVFERVLESVPDSAAAHIGLANACAMRFETTRADSSPDTESLSMAMQHAREACRLDPQSGEAWATLAFILDATRNRLEARAAAARAVTLEPDNWRHQFRLSYVSWGEQRLRGAQRALGLLPGLPLAHWLAATVHVARQTLEPAERELALGLAAAAEPSPRTAQFSTLALHWLRGLIHLSRGATSDALAEFERELTAGNATHLYARECAANTWYAIGALHLREGRQAAAGAAFVRASELVGGHPLARVGLTAVGTTGALASADSSVPRQPDSPVDAAIAQAALLVTRGDHAKAARLVDGALEAAPLDSAGWLLPIEPLLNVADRAEVWVAPLARLRNRAA